MNQSTHPELVAVYHTLFVLGDREHDDGDIAQSWIGLDLLECLPPSLPGMFRSRNTRAGRGDPTAGERSSTVELVH